MKDPQPIDDGTRMDQRPPISATAPKADRADDGEDPTQDLPVDALDNHDSATVGDIRALDRMESPSKSDEQSGATEARPDPGGTGESRHRAAEPASPPNPSLQTGVILKDRFVLEEIVGSGGMGRVFRALDLRKQEARDKDPYIALKVLNHEFRDNPVSLIALQRETKRAQTLSHPNIINVFDFDRDGPHVFMSMEYLRGRPLTELIKKLPKTGMPFKKAWPLIRGMADALAYAHRKNIVHSDFKPGNVFIDENNEVKVLDFGIACAAGRGEADAETTFFNARALGAFTPAYASLEMLENREPDPRDDIFGLGCVAYELLTGKHPFGKLSAAKALELNLQPKVIAGLSRRQWRGLQRALAFRRNDRTPTVEEFIEELQPRSPVVYGAWAVVILAAVMGGINLYLHLIPVPEPPRAERKLTPEQETRVKNLLDVAAIHFEVGYLTIPSGSNALWAYQEVLKIDPYNAQAIQGVQRIADYLEQSAWEALERGDRSESLKKVLEGLEAVPTHRGLLELRRKLEA
jgi:serine/threonine protein kinase